MSSQFVGQIQQFGFGFNPSGWQQCNGQTLSISQNTALFALIGTTYGGNGTTTFQLPDLRGRIPIGQGQGNGLQNYTIGETGGTENVSVGIAQMPLHNHNVTTNNSQGTSPTPSGNVPAGVSFARGLTPDNIYAAAADTTTYAPATVSNIGGSQPHPNLQPYLTTNYCIALVGVFPTRS